MTVANQILEDLPRCRINVEGDSIVSSFSLYDFRRHREIAISRIGGRTDIRLMNFPSRDLPDGHNISRAGRHRDEWLNPGKIDLVAAVVIGIWVGHKLRPIGFASLRLQETARFRIGGKNGSGRA